MGAVRLALLLVLLLAGGQALAFTLGVLPVHSSRLLVERYEPLRAYLERALQQPVRIESAADFARFQARTLHGDFDLAITPCHFARIAQKDLSFQPLAHLEPDHDALLVTRLDRPLASLDDLRGRQLAVVDRLAITVMATTRYLDEQGLASDRDYQVVEHRTHASVVHSLLSGLSAAAVTSSQGLLQLPEESRKKLRVQKRVTGIPAFVFLAKDSLPRIQAERLKSLLLAFPREAEGARFLANTGHTGLHATSEAVMQRVDPYLSETRKVLRP